MGKEYLSLKFTRRVAFGISAQAPTPTDPLAWAAAQLKQTPPIDILERDGSRRTDLPDWVKLRWTNDDVMTAFHGHQEAEKASFEKSKTLSKEQFELERKNDIAIPYWRMEHWKEVQARATTAAYAKEPVFERFWHFWTNHFMVAPGNQNNDVMVGPFQRSLREKMQGSFKDMLWHAVTHPAMLVYLDNNRNTGPNSKAARQKWTKDSVNENLGRELLELFSLSPAIGYTQKDVEATTLILTGWREMKPDKWRKPEIPLGSYFDFDRHEPGSQTVLGKTYSAMFRPSQKLEELIHDLALHKATANHIARKLCVYFMDDAPPQQAIAHVESVFLKTQGSLPAVHTAVLEMCWEHISSTRKFTSPETWFLQTATISGLEIPRVAPLDDRGGLKTFYLLGDLGQPLPRCPQPNGWPIRSSDWISKEMLDRRVRYLPIAFNDITRMNSNYFDELSAQCARFLPEKGADVLAIETALKRKDTRLAHSLFHASPSLLWS